MSAKAIRLVVSCSSSGDNNLSYLKLVGPKSRPTRIGNAVTDLCLFLVQQIIKKLKPAWDWDTMDKNVLSPKQAFKEGIFTLLKGT